MNSIEQRLRIAEIRATPVSVPTLRPSAWSQGSNTGVTRTVIEVTTESGLIGLGEAPGARTAELLTGRLRDKLLGKCAIDRGALQLEALGRHRDFGSMTDGALAIAFAGVEIALLDLLGQAIEMPVYRLLGGAQRDCVPFVSYAYSVDQHEGHREHEVPAIMAGIATQEVAAAGTRFFEFKVGRFTVDCDIETVRAIRAAVGPGVALGVDANMSYSVDAARRFMRGVAPYDLANVEEPVAGLAAMEDLRREFGVPVSTHCSDCEMLRHYPLIDAVVGDFHLNGGIEGNLRKAAAVTALGKRYWLRSCMELGIAWAALCHTAAAMPELERPSQALINWVEDDLIEGEPWLVRDGGVRLSDRPGLGVSLDRPALERYAANFEAIGEHTYYDRP
jgi:glucarate dehydratase